MTRTEFEHVIRAAAAIVNDDIVVVGSQAILAQYPDAPDSLLTSPEVDLYPLNAPERAEEVDAAIGDGSRFHATFDAYAHGVTPETILAPTGWQDRLVRLELPAATARDRTVVAWCLEIHDLVLAKLAGGRPHDLEFTDGAVRANLADLKRLRVGLDLMPESHRDVTRRRLADVFSRLERSG